MHSSCASTIQKVLFFLLFLLFPLIPKIFLVLPPAVHCLLSWVGGGSYKQQEPQMKVLFVYTDGKRYVWVAVLYFEKFVLLILISLSLRATTTFKLSLR